MITGEIPKGVWMAIAIKRCEGWSSWQEIPNAVMSIDDARLAFDGGNIEMAQTRDANCFCQMILFRRKKAEDRAHWFSRSELERFKNNRHYMARRISQLKAEQKKHSAVRSIA